MIISKLIGGLGNQMFQYAAGRSLSLSLETEYRIDISDFNNYSLHNGYELQKVFSCDVPLASKSDVKSIIGGDFQRSFNDFLLYAGLDFFSNKSFYREKSYNFSNNFFNLSPPAYISGYWQSEQYFSCISSQIRSDFTFIQPYSQDNLYVKDLIRSSSSSISVHIRRGDYLTNNKANLFHGLCSLLYYKDAVKYITDRIIDPTFFIFSDDPDWVNEYLILDFPTYIVNHNFGSESYNDMRLMSICDHHIIANSSFSWWGAWLNPSDKKIIIAPKQWFANSTAPKDLLPNNWISI